jgi:hypothetical protein
VSHLTGHFRTVCKYCAKVIAQCRCPNPNKQTIYGVCAACKAERNGNDA